MLIITYRYTLYGSGSNLNPVKYFSGPLKVGIFSMVQNENILKNDITGGKSSWLQSDYVQWHHIHMVLVNSHNA